MSGNVTAYAGTQEGKGQILPFSPLALFRRQWVKWWSLTWRKPSGLTRSPNSKADLTPKHPHRHTWKNVEPGDWTLISQAS